MVKIYRSQNRCAHNIAQWAASNHLYGSIPLISIPQCLLSFHSGKDPPAYLFKFLESTVIAGLYCIYSLYE